MLQIERVRGNKRKREYQIVVQGNGKARDVLLTVNSIEKAACVLRFIHGSAIKGEEYRLAVDTLREIDADNDAEGVLDEILSGEIDLRISDGDTSG